MKSSPGQTESKKLLITLNEMTFGRQTYVVTVGIGITKGFQEISFHILQEPVIQVQNSNQLSLAIKIQKYKKCKRSLTNKTECSLKAQRRSIYRLQTSPS